MNNNISYIQPFSIPMVQMEIDEDTSELKSCNLHTISNLQKEEWRERHSDSKSEKNIERHRILEKFPTTKNILENYVNKALGEIVGYKANFSITSSWITLTPKGSKSQMHSHKNSFWSGVYYFDDNYGDKSGRLTFQNPIAYNLSSFLIETKKVDTSTTPGLHIRPKSKCLILFPSYIYHEIETHHEDGDRHSLAFNIAPTGLYGDGDSTYDTNWFK